MFHTQSIEFCLRFFVYTVIHWTCSLLTATVDIQKSPMMNEDLQVLGVAPLGEAFLMIIFISTLVNSSAVATLKAPKSGIIMRPFILQTFPVVIAGKAQVAQWSISCQEKALQCEKENRRWITVIQNRHCWWYKKHWYWLVIFKSNLRCAKQHLRWYTANQQWMKIIINACNQGNNRFCAHLYYCV